jgi:hypothetical protein
MTTRDNLLAVREAVLAGTDWLDAMLSIEGGDKAFLHMWIALRRHVPAREVPVLLSEHLAGASADQVAGFIERAVKDLPEFEPALPAWPTLNLPMEDAA